MKQDPQFERRFITPEIAQVILDRDNTANRKLNESHVSSLVQQMLKGLWEETGDTIKFAVNGRLLDGQHRLSAVVRAKVGQWFNIAYNLSESAFNKIDTGKKRDAKDILSVDGVKNPNICAAIATLLINIRQNGFDTVYNNTTLRSRGKSSRSSNQEISDYMKANPEIEEVASFVTNKYQRFKGITATQLGALYTIMAAKSQKDADCFFEKYAEGDGLAKDSPIHVLRVQLLQQSSNRVTTKNMRDRIYWFISAWNHFRANKPVVKLQAYQDRPMPHIV